MQEAVGLAKDSVSRRRQLKSIRRLGPPSRRIDPGQAGESSLAEPSTFTALHRCVG